MYKHLCTQIAYADKTYVHIFGFAKRIWINGKFLTLNSNGTIEGKMSIISILTLLILIIWSMYLKFYVVELKERNLALWQYLPNPVDCRSFAKVPSLLKCPQVLACSCGLMCSRRDAQDTIDVFYITVVTLSTQFGFGKWSDIMRGR